MTLNSRCEYNIETMMALNYRCEYNIETMMTLYSRCDTERGSQRMTAWSHDRKCHCLLARCADLEENERNPEDKTRQV
nr:hypothetical protein BgiMline_007372 [Biomphalaria glabrata]